MAKIVYSGDVNLEHGGTYFKIDPRDWDEYGYCSAVRVQPCSDAGAQSNAWWIESFTVLNPKGDDLKSILSFCGWSIAENGAIMDSYSGDIVAKAGTQAFRHCVAEACVGYGKYDKDFSEVVQIGKISEFDSDREHVNPDRILRSNASLERYVRREFVRSL